jgi:hypothetical protein
MPNNVKERSPDQTAISVSISRDLLALIDARAQSLNLTRSRYLALLAQQDLTKGGPLVIPAPDASQPPRVVDANTEVVEFLIIALTAYERHKNQNDLPRPPLPLAESQLWQHFLAELEEISRHKWNESFKAGHDIGAERAIRDWLPRHFALWAAAQAKLENPASSAPL